MTNIETFLKKIGINADTLTKLNSDDANVDEIVTSFKSIQRDVLKNDPEFIQPIKDEIRGEQLSKIEHKIKKTFSLSPDDVKDKKFDDIINVAFEKSTRATNTGAEELQNRLIELTNENKRLVDEIIPAKENEAKAAIKSFKRESIINSMIAKKSLIVSSDVVIPAVNNYLNQNFNVDVDDSGELIVKTKNNLNPLNLDGTKIVTFDEILDGHLASLGVVKQSNGNPNNPTPTETISGTVSIPLGLSVRPVVKLYSVISGVESLIQTVTVNSDGSYVVKPEVKSNIGIMSLMSYPTYVNGFYSLRWP